MGRSSCFSLCKDNYLKLSISNIQIFAFEVFKLYYVLDGTAIRATVDYCRQRIYHRENVLFRGLLYLHTVTVDRSSLYNGFISHRQPKTCPKDMFVSNTMNNCCSDEKWVMEIHSVFFCLRLMRVMCWTSLAILYGSFIGEPLQEKCTDVVIQYMHNFITQTFICWMYVQMWHLICTKRSQNKDFMEINQQDTSTI